IYSAFSISVSERTKQFGLLSSVGATRSQIRSSVLTEALTLSAIGIPLGVLSGIGGIALTLYLLRDKFGSLIGANDVPIHVSVTWQAIAIAAAVALLTVLVSAWIPSGRAMRISPIEAIRQSRDVKAKGKSREKSRLFTKLFGAEGVLASKYYARSRKKYRATIVSLAMSVILFISASAFCMYITRSVDAADNRMNFDGAYYGLIPTGDYERLRPALSEIAPDICAYIYEPRNGDFCYLPADSFTGEYLSYLDELEEGVFASPNVYVFYLDDAAFRALLAKNGLPESDYFGEGADKALLVNHATGTVYKEGTRVSYVFDLLRPGTETVRIGKLPEEEAIPDGYEYGGVCWTGSAFGEGELRACYQPDGWEDPQFDELGRPKDQPMLPLEYEEVRIGAMLAEQPTGSFATGMINIIRPFSQYSGELTTAHFYFRSSSVSASIEKMAELLDANGIKATENNFYDVTEENRLMNNVVTIIKVFSYGFIALISLISVANVFNTVTTNVALRRRDYAMLRSMGMTKKGMNRMSNYECLIYGSRSLLIGLPAAAAVTYLVFLAAKGAANMPFTLPWTAIAIAVASVFLVVFVSMLYSTGKLKKDNPIDALKDENI
ncbi:MAG: ABC transporter permease, partial [Clostridia bacterium]|nr:ABC transporter permease [Clostridia bacterium]